LGGNGQVGCSLFEVFNELPAAFAATGDGCSRAHALRPDGLEFSTTGALVPRHLVTVRCAPTRRIAVSEKLSPFNGDTISLAVQFQVLALSKRVKPNFAYPKLCKSMGRKAEISRA
jgi:hypothetical protein